MDGASEGSGISVIGLGARIEGTFESTGALRIDGQLKGKIFAQGEVLLSAAAVVEADIQAGGGSPSVGGSRATSLPRGRSPSLPRAWSRAMSTPVA